MCIFITAIRSRSCSSLGGVDRWAAATYQGVADSDTEGLGSAGLEHAQGASSARQLQRPPASSRVAITRMTRRLTLRVSIPLKAVSRRPLQPWRAARRIPQVRVRSWRLVGFVAAGLLLACSGRGDGEGRPVPQSTAPSDTQSVPDTSTSPPTVTMLPCDPGGGVPAIREGCPEAAPETAWLRYRDGELSLDRFQTFVNDARGRTYAEAHGLEFPFSNDYYDAPMGIRHTLELDLETICTGIIMVGYREPLEDHVVDCMELLDVAARHRVPVAVWREGAGVVQISELYRP